MSKPLLCRLGFHQTFGDSVAQNLGTATRPVLVFETFETCNWCSWTTQPV